MYFRKYNASTGSWSDPQAYLIGGKQLWTKVMPMSLGEFNNFVRIFCNLRLSGEPKVLYAFCEEIDSKKLVAQPGTPLPAGL